MEDGADGNGSLKAASFTESSVAAWQLGPARLGSVGKRSRQASAGEPGRHGRPVRLRTVPRTRPLSLENSGSRPLSRSVSQFTSTGFSLVWMSIGLDGDHAMRLRRRLVVGRAVSACPGLSIRLFWVVGALRIPAG